MSSADTIFALSSGRLPSGVAIIRLSGPKIRFAFETLIGRIPQPRHAIYSKIRKGIMEVDRGICFYLPGPGSATGEDCGEFHVHGGPAVVKALLTILSELPGFRPAEPGEFTRRAFLNGKFDLTGVEALSDLIAAETEQQRRLAIENVGERQRNAYLGWRQRILSLRALAEAQLDFSDQDDVGESDDRRISAAANEIAQEIDAHVALFRQAEIVRDGYSVVIVGAPNVGKSSLLNALAQREAAIVSDEAGTTRDPVTVAIEIDGYKVNLTDTAGIRDNPGRIEALGIERAVKLAERADLVVRLVDTGGEPEADLGVSPDALVVRTKVDLSGRLGSRLAVSSVTGEGIDTLLKEIGRRLKDVVGAGEDVLPTRERHVRHLNAASRALNQSTVAPLPELQAEELRLAALELGRIVGLSDTEELLGEIFGRFCIGK